MLQVHSDPSDTCPLSQARNRCTIGPHVHNARPLSVGPTTHAASIVCGICSCLIAIIIHCSLILIPGSLNIRKSKRGVMKI